MSLEELIYARALGLTGNLTAQQDGLLRVFSRSAGAELTEGLRPGVRAEEIRERLADAGSLLALAALCESDGSPERFTAGELTVQRGSATSAARELRAQARRLAGAYLQSGFVFAGV